ncbi:uncharacterized protein BDR25DRAFT_360751 [Lindgomyces ingoldianus]|uniref:Uncharacterized protein n=1 Tax=Lindgomyces ingoldianus TaxID=673940 RepID=A0ACB6QDN7_9PLEO|nr:uncharacterized protein BDR25DRAFT_360751 [Lindgomyces ingoldianus]KAF2465134.1 hypothetical protein BDR25DRAFT_360751 [Lindgomyces ingoldianus]
MSLIFAGLIVTASRSPAPRLNISRRYVKDKHCHENESGSVKLSERFDQIERMRYRVSSLNARPLLISTNMDPIEAALASFELLKLGEKPNYSATAKKFGCWHLCREARKSTTP